LILSHSPGTENLSHTGPTISPSGINFRNPFYFLAFFEIKVYASKQVQARYRRTCGIIKHEL
jgi:hypothetical protein